MFFPELTVDDWMLLNRFRLDRLRSLFAQSLLQCLVYVDRHHRLVIHCSEPWIVDSLLTELEELCDYAWLILGVKTIVFLFAQEEIFCVRYSSFDASVHMLL
jgi:hypothetical protein